MLRKSRLIGLFMFAACAAPPDDATLSLEDSTAIRAVKAEYVRAWLVDDTTGVLATLADDAVLMPPGSRPIVGHEAIRAFWWPQDGSRTTIEAFEWEPHELAGQGDLAYTRGLSRLEWTWQQDTVRQQSVTTSVDLTVLRQGAGGEWKITRQIWGQVPN